MQSTPILPQVPETDPHRRRVQPNIPLPHLPGFTTTSDTYAKEVYNNIVEDQEMDTFLQEVEGYDLSQRRWSFPASPEGLLLAVFNVLESVIGRFVRSETPGVDRAVLCTTTTPGCNEKNEDGYRACPLLVVRADGPSFELPELEGNPILPEDFAYYVGFTNMASYITPKTEQELGSDEDILRETASYARYLLYAQPNRFYVRSLVITEEHARLVHIDRAGAQITPPIDIHRDPATLVRIIAGLSSTNERLLGIDDSVQWTIVDGKKGHGTLTTTGPSGESKTYRILEAIPVPRDSVLGRGTTCWRVQDPETLEEYVVKDAWRPGSLVPEHDLLELVKGIPGVVHMVSYETGRGEIKDFRCSTTSGQYHNRIASRTTTKAYGKSIVCFTSILQLLYAIRDAIAGHQRLGGDGLRILHRDISHNNVLLGKEGAPVGERGIVIDLDMAFRATDAKPAVRTNHNIGTRLFQSISVLESARLREKALLHDHIDELESFFYLLTYILLLFKPDGTRLASNDEGPAMAWAWAVEDPDAAELVKGRFRRIGTPAMRSNRLIRASWGPPCGVLFLSFLRWIMKRTEEKSDICDDDGGCERDLRNGTGPSQLFYSRRDEHYAAVLQLFDHAIDEIKASTPPTDVDVPQPASPSPDTPVVDGDLPPASNCHQDANDVCSLVPAPAPIGLNPTAELPAPEPSADVEMVEPPTCVGDISPTPPPPPHPPAVPAPLRRSARIQDICLQKSRQHPVPAVNASRSMKFQASAPQPTSIEPRRSTRIQKRRLDEEEHADVPQPKVRRTKTGHRMAIRSR